MKRIGWWSCGALLWLPLVVAAQQTPPPGEESQREPGEVESIPLPSGEEAPEIPQQPGLQWHVSTLVQGDGLANSSLPSSREKTAVLRRARLSGLVDWTLDWRFKAGVDLAQPNPGLRDLSVEYRGFPIYIEAGRIVEPFGVLPGSSRSSAFMERPLSTGLSPGYGIGATGNARGDKWGITLGVFKSTKNNEQEGGREENAVDLRATLAPVHKDNAVLHFGLEASYRESKAGLLQFVAIPETVLLLGMDVSSALLFADSSHSDKNRYQLYGLEFAGAFGPVMMQIEGNLAEIHNATAVGFGSTGQFSDATFTGWYLETDWAMTKERRDYSTRRGVFSGIDPNTSILNHGIGALELAFRVSFLDLLDSNLGGQEGVVGSLGLNWYPEDHSKVMLEYLAIHKGDSSGNSENETAIQARLQVFFAAP
jgi:phosphate-selective porin